MSYTDIGFDEFLNRELPDAKTQYMEANASYLLPQLSGSVIGGGITTSADGKVIINWDTGEVIFSDGARGRVFLGKIVGSDSYGIKIIDAEGNEVLSALGKLQSGGLEDGAVTTTKIANLAVTSAKILSLDADKINVDQLDALAVNTGTLVVDESITAGDGTVVLDDDGILVDGGKIVVKDDSGENVIDAKGLVSTTSFLSDSVEKTNNQTIDGDDGWVDITQLTLTFTLARQTNVLFMGYTTIRHEEFDQPMFVRFVLDGVSIGHAFVGGMDWYEGTYGNSFVYSVSEGEHTIKLQANAILGGTNGYILGSDYGSSCTLSYVTLGK